MPRWLVFATYPSYISPFFSFFFFNIFIIQALRNKQQEIQSQLTFDLDYDAVRLEKLSLTAG